LTSFTAFGDGALGDGAFRAAALGAAFFVRRRMIRAGVALAVFVRLTVFFAVRLAGRAVFAAFLALLLAVA
jgi:hypothetical protein